MVVFQRTKGFLKMTSPVTPVLDEFMTGSAPGSYFNKFNISCSYKVVCIVSSFRVNFFVSQQGVVQTWYYKKEENFASCIPTDSIVE